jgi:hypothetical protein
MGFFSRSDIKLMRKYSENYLPDLAYVTMPVEDNTGRFPVTTWADEEDLQGIPCRLSASQVGPSPGEVPVWLVILKAGVTVLPNRRIRVVGLDPVTGEQWERRLEVQAVTDPRTSSIMTKVYCWELQ